jgi:hypothetical protein
VAFDLERRADGVDQAMRGVARGIPPLQARQHHGKLVTAQAGQGVVFTQLAAQALAQLAQQFVAKGMAEGVVDVLEVVQVQAQCGGQLGVFATTHQRLAKALVNSVRLGNPVSASWCAMWWICAWAASSSVASSATNNT